MKIRIEVESGYHPVTKEWYPDNVELVDTSSSNPKRARLEAIRKCSIKFNGRRVHTYKANDDGTRGEEIFANV